VAVATSTSPSAVRYSTPVARTSSPAPDSTIRCAWAWVMTVRFSRSIAGWRNASYVEERFPARVVVWNSDATPAGPPRSRPL
jgi:hypothetical protein